MKTIKTLLLVVAIMFSSVLSASTLPPTSGPDDIREAVYELLDNPSFILEENLEAFVTLKFNKHNEIVVLSVDSESRLLEEYVKERLNYKRVDFNISDKNETFLIPVRMQIEN